MRAVRNCCACMVLSLLVCGCWTTTAPDPSAGPDPAVRARLEQVAAEARAANRGCLEAALAKPDYAELRTKLYLSLEEAEIPSQYLTDPSFPTKKQIADLYKWHADLQGCRKVMLDRVAKWLPFVIANMVEMYAESDRLYTEAVSGRLPWGQFNEARKALADRNKARLAEDARAGANAQDKQQFAAEQRERAAAAMQQWTQRQQQLNKIRQTRMITCSYAGTVPTCT